MALRGLIVFWLCALSTPVFSAVDMRCLPYGCPKYDPGRVEYLTITRGEPKETEPLKKMKIPTFGTVPKSRTPVVCPGTKNVFSFVCP